MTLRPCGDCALVIQLGAGIDPAINRRVHALAQSLALNHLKGVVTTIPTYASLLVRYDPLVLAYAEVEDWIRSLAIDLEHQPSAPARLIEIPVQYGGEAGFDLPLVADYCHLSIDDVVRLHCEREYIVYMMGFTPGYPYMGVVDERLRLPRLASPRSKVPAGSVAIAGLQTGIYSIESPGGWHVIGRTPLVLFDPARAEPFLFAPGDRVKFEPL
jgi:KipI family sensor histidine kinase inhibitor